MRIKMLGPEDVEDFDLAAATEVLADTGFHDEPRPLLLRQLLSVIGKVQLPDRLLDEMVCSDDGSGDESDHDDELLVSGDEDEGDEDDEEEQEEVVQEEVAQEDMAVQAGRATRLAAAALAAALDE
jgi:hypothetical protein